MYRLLPGMTEARLATRLRVHALYRSYIYHFDVIIMCTCADTCILYQIVMDTVTATLDMAYSLFLWQLQYCALEGWLNIVRYS